MHVQIDPRHAIMGLMPYAARIAPDQPVQNPAHHAVC